MRFAICAWTLAALVGCGGVAASSGRVSDHPVHGSLAYVVGDITDAGGPVRLLGPDGSKRTLGTGALPVWSMDGRAMVFGTQQGLTIVWPSGDHETQTIVDPNHRETPAWFRQPAWSPAGTLAYALRPTFDEWGALIGVSNDPTAGFYMRNAFDPQWAQDGSLLYVVSDGTPSFDLNLKMSRPQGFVEAKLPPLTAAVFLAPDGNTAFAVSSDGGTYLLQFAEKITILDSPFAFRRVSWASDSQTFCGSDGLTAWVGRLDESELRPVGGGGACAISPDGLQVAVSGITGQAGHPSFIVDLETGAIIGLEDGAMEVAWAP